jgi:uncharacterized protein with GYD domain
MPKFLFQASYTAEGAQGLLKDGGSKRRAQVEETIKKLGGKMETFYYVFGDPDAFVIVDLPDAVSASAVSLAINKTGIVRCRTSVLITPEEMDQATKKTVSYKAPGT